MLLPWAGCKSTSQQNPPAVHLIWPDPPEQPRVAYVESLSQSADFGIKRSVISKLTGLLTGSGKGVEAFQKPFAVALDEADNLCLTDTGANTVWFFDLTSKQAIHWSTVGKVRFVSPVGIAKRGDRIFVADSGLGAVLVFDTKGRLVNQIVENLARPVALAISGEKLFVVDSQQNSIAAFELGNGKFLYRFGKRGAANGEFNFPTHISISPEGTMLVTDSMNGRIQIFDSEGLFKGVVGSLGDSSGHFGRPKGVASDTFGRVYVVDALYDNLQIFDRAGPVLLSLGEPGSRPGQFWMPSGIAITRDNRIFIADSYNHRVQVLKYVGPS